MDRSYKVEGDLRRDITMNIKRLVDNLHNKSMHKSCYDMNNSRNRCIHAIMKCARRLEDLWNITHRGQVNSFWRWL
jgi:hypothetical protein